MTGMIKKKTLDYGYIPVPAFGPAFGWFKIAPGDFCPAPRLKHAGDKLRGNDGK